MTPREREPVARHRLLLEAPPFGEAERQHVVDEPDVARGVLREEVGDVGPMPLRVVPEAEVHEEVAGCERRGGRMGDADALPDPPLDLLPALVRVAARPAPQCREQRRRVRRRHFEEAHLLAPGAEARRHRRRRPPAARARPPRSLAGCPSRCRRSGRARSGRTRASATARRDGSSASMVLARSARFVSRSSVGSAGSRG